MANDASFNEAIKAMASEAGTLSALTGLALVVPGLYGTYDLFAGPTNGLNSGELAANSAIGLLPLAGLGAGAALGAQVNPASRYIFNEGARTMMNQSPTPEEVAERQRRGMAYQQQMRDLRGEMLAKDPSLSDAVMDARILRRGLRNTLGGALAGTLATGIPAVMMMRDAPMPEVQGSLP